MTPAIATHEQLGLVVLSVAVAIVAGYLALDLAQRSADATGAVRRAWIVAGGVTIGLGIWSMHFIGMLALRMAMPVSYDLPLAALSMIAAMSSPAWSAAASCARHSTKSWPGRPSARARSRRRSSTSTRSRRSTTRAATGVASWDGTQTAAQLIASADAFLTAAKAAGRNRTASTLADPPAKPVQYS